MLKSRDSLGEDLEQSKCEEYFDDSYRAVKEIKRKGVFKSQDSVPSSNVWNLGLELYTCLIPSPSK